MKKILYNKFMVTSESSYQSEERIVAELAQLGVSYLSRKDGMKTHLRPPQNMLADLVLQPYSRVRVALIALLLAKPEYAAFVPGALKYLDEEQAQTMKLLYSAAVYLQRKYTQALRSFQDANWKQLPNLFGDELGLREGSPQDCLKELARIQAQRTGMQLNWIGTYENAARHLLRRWKLEREWKR